MSSPTRARTLMPEAQGRKNVYRCNECPGAIVTVNQDEGTTPMFLRCRATDGCAGMMQSSWYVIPPNTPDPGWEWYRPGASALRRLHRKDPATADHVERGGLLIRKIGTPA